MFDTKQKYVRLASYNQIIIFPQTVKHSEFKNYDIVSAGFCYVNAESKKVECFGQSDSLGIKSHETDTAIATKQIFGVS